MNLINFNDIYSDKESCKLKFKKIRDTQGVVCSHCEGIEHFWKGDNWQYELKSLITVLVVLGTLTSIM